MLEDAFACIPVHNLVHLPAFTHVFKLIQIKTNIFESDIYLLGLYQNNYSPQCQYLVKIIGFASFSINTFSCSATS